MRGRWAQGLEPRGFTWVIKDRLAASERPGGFARNHRKVRRQEELIWLAGNGFTHVLSLLESPHNLHAYDEAADRVRASPARTPRRVGGAPPRHLRTLKGWLDDPAERVLIHHEEFGERLLGILAGYLLYAGSSTTGRTPSSSSRSSPAASSAPPAARSSRRPSTRGSPAPARAPRVERRRGPGPHRGAAGARRARGARRGANPTPAVRGRRRAQRRPVHAPATATPSRTPSTTRRSRRRSAGSCAPSATSSSSGSRPGSPRYAGSTSGSSRWSSPSASCTRGVRAMVDHVAVRIER